MIGSCYVNFHDPAVKAKIAIQLDVEDFVEVEYYDQLKLKE